VASGHSGLLRARGPEGSNDLGTTPASFYSGGKKLATRTMWKRDEEAGRQQGFLISRGFVRKGGEANHRLTGLLCDGVTGGERAVLRRRARIFGMPGFQALCTAAWVREKAVSERSSREA